MKKNTTHIEQLYQELLSQDPSLASQKSEILGLLERMTQHKPIVSIDPLFESRLRDNLRYHMVSQYTPAPQMSNWQKFLVYGIPSLAIGLALIYVLPSVPSQPDTTIMTDITTPIVTNSSPETTNSTTTPNSSSDMKNKKETSIPVQQSVKKEQQNSSQTITSSSYDAKTSESSDPVITTEPMMLKTISTPEGGESTTNDTMMMQDHSSSQKSTPLSPTSQQTIYKNDTFTLHYNLYRSGEDIQFEGMIDHCKNSYTISEYLVATSSDATIYIIAKDTSSDQKIKLTITFKDSIITTIEGGDQCK